MATAILPRSLGTVRWNILADLHRAGRPVNAKQILQANSGDRDILRMLMEGGLVTVRRARDGENVPFESAWYFNEYDMHLTDRGRAVAARVSHLAGILLYLSRSRGRTQLRHVLSTTGCDRTDIDELNGLAYIVAYADPDTGDNPINLAARLGDYRDCWIELTAAGRLRTI